MHNQVPFLKSLYSLLKNSLLLPFKPSLEIFPYKFSNALILSVTQFYSLVLIERRKGEGGERRSSPSGKLENVKNP